MRGDIRGFYRGTRDANVTESDLYVHSVKEVAQILRVSAQTIYNNIWSGKIKATKYKGVYCFTDEQLTELIENGYK